MNDCGSPDEAETSHGLSNDAEAIRIGGNQSW